MFSQLRQLHSLLPKWFRFSYIQYLILALSSSFLDSYIVILLSRLFSLLTDPNPSALIVPLLASIHTSFVNPIHSYSLILIILVSTTYILKYLALRQSLFLSASVGSFLSTKLYNLSTSYEFYTITSRHKSRLLNNILNDINRIVVFLELVYRSFLSVVNILFILFAIFSLFPLPSFIIITIALLLFFLLNSYFKPNLQFTGTLVQTLSQQYTSFLSESYIYLRSLLLYNENSYFQYQHSSLTSQYRSASARSTFLSSQPKLVIEFSLYIFIPLLILFLPHSTIIAFLPVFGTLAISFQKLLPLTNDVYGCYSRMLSYQPSVTSFLQSLSYFTIQTSFLPSISTDSSRIYLHVSNLNLNTDDGKSLYYPDLSFSLPFLSRLLITGATGSGKSTLLELLLSLRKASSGQVNLAECLLPNRDHLDSIHHLSFVPQAPFIPEVPLISYLTSFVPLSSVDYFRLDKLLSDFCLADLMSDLPNHLHTNFSNHDFELSGGQVQRLALVKALYVQPSLLVLDEFTSSLDYSTESSILHSLHQYLSTCSLICISHRPLSELQFSHHLQLSRPWVFSELV